jgi:hypothetical protein
MACEQRRRGGRHDDVDRPFRRQLREEWRREDDITQKTRLYDE